MTSVGGGRQACAHHVGDLIGRQPGELRCGPRPAVRAAGRPVPLPAVAGSSRQVATHSTGSADRLSLRYSRIASVSGSAQCRSSSTSSSPAGPARRRSSCSTASPRTAGEWSPCPSPSAPAIAGRIARSAGSHGASPSSAGNGAPAQCLQQGLGQRPVGAGDAGRYRPAGQDPDAAGPRRGGQLRGQPGLADPGLAGQEHQPARAVPGRGERGPQRAGLRLAADDHRAQQVRHQISMLRRRLPGTGWRPPPARIRVHTHAPLPSSRGRGRPGLGVTCPDSCFRRCPRSRRAPTMAPGPRAPGPGTKGREHDGNRQGTGRALGPGRT